MEPMLARGGVAGALIRERDWAGTAVGVMEAWPQSLRTALSVCLLSKFPMFVFWGPDMVQFYNDMFVPVMGSKHPAGLGQLARDCWRETWDLVGPMLNGVMAGGEASYFDDLPVTLERSGYTEECYFTFCYTPVHDEAGKVGGIFGTVSETTTRVVGERRLQILRELSDIARAVDSAAEVCAHAAEVLAKHPVDVPYALIYLLDADGANARLAAATGLSPDDPLRQPAIQLTGDGPWPLALDAHGPFLGVIPDPHFPQITAELEPGNVLLLHTDGLTERNPHLRDEAELQALLTSVDGHDAHQILEQIERQSLGPGPRRLADDVAILLLRAQSRWDT
jgi:hypothetical protein